MKTVLITGGSGFIGQHCLALLHSKGYEVHSVSTEKRASNKFVIWHQTNLLDHDQVRMLIRNVKPSHLLLLAWNTKHDEYWTSLDNLNWVQSTLFIMKEFNAIGGKRIVSAGTCAEYEWGGREEYLEYKTSLLPKTLYGNYKYALYLMMDSWSKQIGMSMAWARIFSVYGPFEHQKRLVPTIIINLLKGSEAICNNPNLIRDYLYTKDVSSALVTLLGSDICGAVNIGSGEAIKLEELIIKIAIILNARHLVKFNNSKIKEDNQDKFLVPNIGRLMSTGWTRSYDLEEGLKETINWWKKQHIS